MPKSPKEPFRLQFTPEQIKPLAARYEYGGDADALKAGQRIARGDFSRANLEMIFRWKTGGRGISRLSRNSESEICDALELAVNAKTERAALAVLCGLTGIDVPVASAVLTAIDPERYTVLDYRALESLGVELSWYTYEFYLTYLDECRKLAGQNSVSLRNLDRALWQWSKERSL